MAAGNVPLEECLKPLLMRIGVMEDVTIDSLITTPWTEQEIKLLKTLMDLNRRIDILSRDFGRAWTATGPNAIELRLI